MPPKPVQKPKKRVRKKKEAENGSSSHQRPPKKRLSKQERRQRKRIVTSVVVLVAAVLLKLGLDYWDHRKRTFERTKAADFIENFVCKHGYCNPALVPHERSQKTVSRIGPGERVIEIPRSIQIWDIDALRSAFARDELRGARHPKTNNTVDSGAYLAAYLVHRFELNKTEDDPLLPYYDILPPVTDLERSFPTLVPHMELQEHLHPSSSSLQVIRAYKDMLNGEYEAFSRASTQFNQTVTIPLYFRMRTLVLSRSFGTGPQRLRESERQELSVRFGLDLSDGGHAMVPLLDMYNHHARPNVQWRLEPSTEAYVVKSNGIAEGVEVMDSYGTYTDSHLFAKFGFVNGDGSGHTQASIAVFHRMMDWGLGHKGSSYLPDDAGDPTRQVMLQQQKYILARYLAFDDGYSSCIKGPEETPNAWTLKQLKLKHLMRLANMPAYWVVTMKPRNASATPLLFHSDVPVNINPPSFDFNALDFDGKKIMSICRLISLTWKDMEEKAIFKLQEALVKEKDTPLFLNYQNDGSEYRALMTLVRLSGMALRRYDKDGVSEEILRKKVRDFNRHSYGKTLEWAAAHVNLGELQTLETLRKMAMSGVQEYRRKLSPEDDSVEAIMRLQPIRSAPCPDNYTQRLLEETNIKNYV